MTAPTPTIDRPTGGWRLKRRHVLMLALAAEVLVLGARAAERYKPAGITVEVPSTRGHVIT